MLYCYYYSVHICVEATSPEAGQQEADARFDKREYTNAEFVEVLLPNGEEPEEE